MTVLRRVTMAFMLLQTLSIGAASPVDVYSFPDAQSKARYKALIDEFRCPKCLNTNIAGSDAPIAQDLRRTVHRLVVQEGMTDQQVRDYLQKRYGDFVLYDPPFNARTGLVWILPVILLLIGCGVLVMLHRRARLRDQQVHELSPDERQRVNSLLEEP